LPWISRDMLFLIYWPYPIPPLRSLQISHIGTVCCVHFRPHVLFTRLTLFEVHMLDTVTCVTCRRHPMTQFMRWINVVSNAAVGTEEWWHPTDRPRYPWEVDSTTGKGNHTVLSLHRYDNMVLQFYYLVGSVRSHKFSAKNVSCLLSTEYYLRPSIVKQNVRKKSIKVCLSFLNKKTLYKWHLRVFFTYTSNVVL